MAADIRHVVEAADGVDPQRGDDHAGEGAVAVMQRARQVHVPCRTSVPIVLGPTNILPSSKMPLGQRTEVVPVADVAADRLRHGAVANAAALVGDEQVRADLVQQHELVAPGQQAEMLGIGLPGMGEGRERLVDFEQDRPEPAARTASPGSPR